MTGTALPAVDALYLDGGYPEVHAAGLAANARLRATVRAFALDGGAVYAGCGGLMHLAESLEDPDGTAHSMADVLPIRLRMRPAGVPTAYRVTDPTAGESRAEGTAPGRPSRATSTSSSARGPTRRKGSSTRVRGRVRAGPAPAGAFR